MSPRPRLASDEDILMAAFRAIARLGPARLTLADVAREAGVSAAALVQRFGSKRALLRAAAAAAESRGIAVKVGNVHSADLFYNPDPPAFDRMETMGVLAVEMEAAGLYGVAAEKGGRALTIATVSDHVRTGASTTSEERQQTFDEMVVIALETVRADAG